MSRIYTVVFANVSISAAQDLFALSPAANKPIEIVGLVLNQVGLSDVGDAQEELLRYSVMRGHTTTATGGSSATPQAVKPSEAAAGFTAHVNGTTIATGGSPVTLVESSFNVRSGTEPWWPDQTEPGASAANTTMVVRLNAAPSDAITLSGTLYVRELG